MIGKLIALEGIDGAGTTTQAERLEAWLRSTGRAVLRTREPSDLDIGRFLRRLLAREIGPVATEAMALLFAADRMDHLAREIEPALARGAHVVTDRYYLSSLAYQTQSTDAHLVLRLNERARTPDLTLFLEVPAEVAAERRAHAGRPDELFDALSLQRRIAAAYAELAASPPRGERVIRIDGTAGTDAVEAAVQREVEALIR